MLPILKTVNAHGQPVFLAIVNVIQEQFLHGSWYVYTVADPSQEMVQVLSWFNPDHEMFDDRREMSNHLSFINDFHDIEQKLGVGEACLDGVAKDNDGVVHGYV